jgi:hypothetical protein
MHYERRRLGRQPIGPVLDRQADEKPGRVDRDLGGESDQTAVALVFVGCRDDQQGVVKLPDKSCEILVNGPHP